MEPLGTPSFPINLIKANAPASTLHSWSSHFGPWLLETGLCRGPLQAEASAHRGHRPSAPSPHPLPSNPCPPSTLGLTSRDLEGHSPLLPGTLRNWIKRSAQSYSPPYSTSAKRGQAWPSTVPALPKERVAMTSYPSSLPSPRILHMLRWVI